LLTMCILQDYWGHVSKRIYIEGGDKNRTFQAGQYGQRVG
jgi:hypothetical protein